MSATFDCATAPAVLGHPDARVERCDQVRNTTNLWFVRLVHPDGAIESRLLLATEAGPFAGTGLAALGRFLGESGVARDPTVTVDMALWWVKAAVAYPPGWSEMDGAGQIPGIGAATTFRANPLVLTLYRQRALPPAPLPPELANPLGIGVTPPGERRGPVERATLAQGPDGAFAWTIATPSGTGWTETARYPLGP